MKLRLNAVAFVPPWPSAKAHGKGRGQVEKWIDAEFQPSTLSKYQQMAEMKWFIEAAKKLHAKGVKEIGRVRDDHHARSKTLAKAFTEITGITVKHDLIQEGDVVEKLQTSMQSGKSMTTMPGSSSDLIGMHAHGKIMNLTDYMAGKGKEYTNPGIDIKDFIDQFHHRSRQESVSAARLGTNLYWFRADLFARQDLKEELQEARRLRPRRATELERLRGHRRVLHQ